MPVTDTVDDALGVCVDDAVYVAEGVPELLGVSVAEAVKVIEELCVSDAD